MIRFKYFLTGTGWAMAVIGNGRTGMTVPASYLCDALGDLVEAVQSLFVISSTECVWELEPGWVRWTFQRRGTSLILRVNWNDRETFAGDDDLLHFSREVIRELDDLLAVWGTDGYLKKWSRYPFPKEAYRKLEHRIRSESERRAAEG